MNKVMYPTTPREERHDIPWITDLEGLHEWIDSIIAGVKDMLHTHQISICGTQLREPAVAFMDGDMLLMIEYLAADLQTAGIPCCVRLLQSRDLSYPDSIWGCTRVEVITSQPHVDMSDMWIAETEGELTRCLVEYFTASVLPGGNE